MPASSLSESIVPSSLKWFERFVKGIEIGRPVGDGFGETGTAPTMKGSTRKATTVKRRMLKTESSDCGEVIITFKAGRASLFIIIVLHHPRRQPWSSQFPHRTEIVLRSVRCDVQVRSFSPPDMSDNIVECVFACRDRRISSTKSSVATAKKYFACKGNWLCSGCGNFEQLALSRALHGQKEQTKKGDYQRNK